MRIGELSRRTGVSERMLRYYEEQALLHPHRTAAGYREYSERDLRTVQSICQLGQAGLRLESIRVLLPCVIDGAPSFHPCAQVRASLRDELNRVDAKLDALMQSRQVLARFVTQVEA